MMRSLAVLSLIGFSLAAWLPLVSSALAQGVDLIVDAQAINRFDASGQNRFGKLEFRGGLVLSSGNKDFGGISGLSLSADGGRLLAITDRGDWIAGTLRQEGDRPLGLGNVTLMPILGPNGRTLASSGHYDTEALAHTPEGFVIGVERQHSLWLLPGENPLLTRAELIFSGGALNGLEANAGLEALVAAPPGAPFALVAMGEESPSDPTTLPGFLFSPLRGAKMVGTFSIERIDGFSATDMALADDGRLYLLERRFDMLRGVAMRIRRFAFADIKPGARLRGEVLIEANRLASIDNMEAIAVHRSKGGEVILTLMSDDNFSLLQRTLLLRFAVLE